MQDRIPSYRLHEDEEKLEKNYLKGVSISETISNRPCKGLFVFKSSLEVVKFELAEGRGVVSRKASPEVASFLTLLGMINLCMLVDSSY